VKLPASTTLAKVDTRFRSTAFVALTATNRSTVAI